MVNVLDVKRATGGLLVAGPSVLIYYVAVIGIVSLFLMAVLLMVATMYSSSGAALTSQEHDQSLLSDLPRQG